MGGGHHGPPHSGGYHQPLRSAQTVATSVKNVLVSLPLWVLTEAGSQASGWILPDGQCTL